MRLSKKLSEWQAAGLLDAPSAARIRQYEERSARALALHAMLGLGGLTIGLGIISVVAANWHGIANSVKLTVDLLLISLLALGMQRAEQRRWPLAREVLVTIYYLFTLASLALVAQTYQLGTPIWMILAAWSSFTLPLMLLVRSRFVAVLWVFGLTATFAYWVADVAAEFLAERFATDLSFNLAQAWAITLLSLAQAGRLKSARPAISQVFGLSGWSLLIASGALAPFVFYGGVAPPAGFASLAALFSAALLGLVVWRLRSWYPRLARRARVGITLTLALGWLTISSGTLLARPSLDMLGACIQLLYLGLLAWTAVALGWMRVFNTLTALMALRVLIIYFEVFGSMLNTGLGMITGGTLTLLLAWAWKRKSPELAAELTPKAAGDNAA